MATKAQVQNCINIVAPLAQAQYNLGKKILPSVCIAQACCESAYMTSPKMVTANALFGIKVGKNKVHFGKGWKDRAYSAKTKECYDGKTYTDITDMFRAYDTVAEAVEDYYDMLCSCSRYRGAVGEADYMKVITAIKNGGYATSPTYVNTIVSIIKANNLTQYDNAYPLLKKGSRGAYVKILQSRLNAMGYRLDEDGIFGSITESAVISFQGEKGLVKDGKVGPKTWAVLNS